MALSDREDFLLSLSSFFWAIVLARLGVIYLPHLPPPPDLHLITHSVIVFLLFSLCSWLLKIPKEHYYLSVGKVAKL